MWYAALHVVVAFAGGQVPPQQLSARGPAAVVREAEAAVLGDSVAAVSARWHARVHRDSTDWNAALGLASLSRLTGDPTTAERLYHNVLKADGLLRVYAAMGLGQVKARRGDFTGANEDFSAAAAYAAVLGNTAAEAETHALLAQSRLRTTGATAALSELDRADRLIPDDSSRLRALALCGRAAVLVQTMAPGARPLAASGARLAARANDPWTRATCLHALAADLDRSGMADSAIAVYGEAAREHRATRDLAGLASTLQWQGWLLRRVGAYGESLWAYDEAERAAARSGNADTRAWALVGMADVEQTVGDLVTAVSLTDSAARLGAGLGDRLLVSMVAGRRAALLSAMGRREDARSAYEHALALFRHNAQCQGVYASAVGLAHLAIRDSLWADADRWLDTAQVAAVRCGMTGLERGLAYHRGVLALHRGRLDQAEARFRQGLERTSTAQGDRRFRYAARLAEVSARRGDVALAERDLTTALDAFDTWRASLDRPRLRALAYQASDDVSDPDLGVATVVSALASNGRTEAAYGLAERIRARALLDQLTRIDALRVRHAAEPGPTPGAEPSLTPATQPEATRTLDAAEAMAALPDDATALFQYVTGTGGEPTTLFVLTRRAMRAFRLPPVDSLAPLIDRFRRLLEAGAGHTSLGRALGAALLAPAVADLPPGIDHVVLVPDGVLHRLPFDALALADGRYVVERFALSRVPSADVAARLWAGPTRGGDAVLVLADPDLRETASAAPGAKYSRGAGIPPLPGAQREAAAVARFGHATVISRARATERWLKNTPLAGFDVVHFATHAVVDEHTLTGTGLFLAAGGGEDGFVTPAELATLELNAKLVVLSSCQTGNGFVARGEGSLGLVAPLLAAGARSVLATRWVIEDDDPLPLVRAFYEGLADSLDVGDALWQAKRKLLAAGAPARQWAGFTLFGDAHVRVPLHRRPAPKLIWVAIGGIFVLLAGSAYRSRIRNA
jgi:tetratricopeptide (TPR) repeat protein